MLFYLCIVVSLVFALRLPQYRDESIYNVVIVYRSPSNFLLALARVLTPVMSVFGVVLILVLLYQAAAFFDVVIRPGIVEPFEPHSLVFVLVNLLVTLLFWTSLATLISQVYRSAAVGFVGTFVLLMLQANIAPLLPGELGSFTFGYGAASLYVSDLAPNYWDFRHVAYFLSIPCLSLAMIYAVAMFDSRLDPAKRTMYLPAAVTLTAVCIGCQALVHGVTLHAIGQHQSWIQALEETGNSIQHQALVKGIVGDVEINPGSSLALRLEYTIGLANESSESISEVPPTLKFGFNPGMKVEYVRCFSSDLAFTHKDGILEIDVHSCASDTDHEYTFELAARGKPAPHYLVEHIPRNGRTDVDVQMVKLMGQRSSVFTENYVGLTPSSHWYPQLLGPPSVLERQSVASFPEHSLAIGLDRKSWTVVSADGRVLNAGNSHQDSLVINGKFQAVGLLAADFRVDTRSYESIDVNVLVHKRHARRLDRNELLVNGLVTTVDEAISSLQDYGIDYPREQFSIVEIPSTLSLLDQVGELNAGMDSVVTYRESGLPFVRPYRLEQWRELSKSRESESRFYQEQFGYRIRYFWFNPIFNQTYEDAIVGSLLAGRIDGASEESVLAGLVLESFLLDLLNSSKYRFDFVLANSLAPRSRVNIPFIWAQRHGQSGRDLYDFKRVQLSSIAYWESIEQALTGGKNDTVESSLQKRAQRFRVVKLSELFDDSFDDKTMAGMVASIFEVEQFKPLDLNQLIAVANSLDVEIAPLIQNTLLNTDLPGFNFSVAKQTESEIPNEHGHRFKTVLELRNSTNSVGYVTFLIEETRQRAEGNLTLRFGTNSSRLGPFEVSPMSSHRLAVNTEDMLWPFRANTFLSLNRGLVTVSVSQAPITQNQIEPEDSTNEWYSFVPSLWNSEENENEVIVDDLDPEFDIPSSNYRQDAFTWTLGSDLFGNHYAREKGMDNGLPVGTNPIGPWIRSSNVASWGRFRHTYALGDTSKPGIHRVSFNAELPKAGRWSLSYHLPDVEYFLGFQQATLGEYEIDVIVEDQEWELAVSAEDWIAGWNEIAKFDIESEGQSSVSVSNRNDQPFVFADAIKWTYLD